VNTARVRRRRLTALLCAGALVLGACGSDDDDDPVAQEETTEGDGGTTGETTETTEAAAESEPVTGGEVVMAVESETNSYLPGKFAGSEAGYNVARAVYDSLMLKDDEGTLQPYLAESLEPNEDFTQYTLKLREGVLFHDGTPLNAEAIKYAFDNHLKVAGSTVAGNLRDVDSVTVVDDLTVTYDLNRANAAFPDLLQGPIGWPFSPTAAQAAGEDFGSQPVGTGPFKLVSYTRDNATVLERNEDYWQEGLPYLDRITFRPIPDEESRLAAFQSGDVDAVHSVRLSGFGSQVRALDDVEVFEGPATRAAAPSSTPRSRRSTTPASAEASRWPSSRPTSSTSSPARRTPPRSATSTTARRARTTRRRSPRPGPPTIPRRRRSCSTSTSTTRSARTARPPARRSRSSTTAPPSRACRSRPGHPGLLAGGRRRGDAQRPRAVGAHPERHHRQVHRGLLPLRRRRGPVHHPRQRLRRPGDDDQQHHQLLQPAGGRDHRHAAHER
jgi:hypothetical protein